MIFIVGGTLAFFFEFLLLSKKKKSLSDKILTFWMLLFGLHLFLHYFSTKGIDFEYPHLLGIDAPFPLIHSPLLFLYTGSLTGYFNTWKHKYLFHFSPPLLFYLYYFNFYISSGQEKVNQVKIWMENPDVVFMLIYPLFVVSALTYIILTFSLFRNHKKNLQNILSFSSEKNNLHWLRNLILGLTAVWLVVFVGGIIFDPSVLPTAIFVTVVFFVISIGFFGVRQGDIFVNLQNVAPIIDSSIKTQQRYSKSGLREEQAVEVQQQLTKLMEEKKLYLDENLSLPQLAQQLNIHPNYLSQVINEKFSRNFYDFVNLYRIEEFKRRVTLEENKKLTFFALALDCGFNSKASFNNSFKKFSGTTPSEFVKSL